MMERSVFSIMHLPSCTLVLFNRQDMTQVISVIILYVQPSDMLFGNPLKRTSAERIVQYGWSVVTGSWGVPRGSGCASIVLPA